MAAAALRPPDARVDDAISSFCLAAITMMFFAMP